MRDCARLCAVGAWGGRRLAFGETGRGGLIGDFRACGYRESGHDIGIDAGETGAWVRLAKLRSGIVGIG